MVILPKAICRFNAISIKISTQFFTEIERAIFKCIQNNKKPRVAKTILNNKRTSQGIIISVLKLYFRAILIKIPHGICSEMLRQIDGVEMIIKSTHLQLSDLWQRSENHPVEERQHIQQIVLTRVAVNIQSNAN